MMRSVEDGARIQIAYHEFQNPLNMNVIRFLFLAFCKDALRRLPVPRYVAIKPLSVILKIPQMVIIGI